MADCYCGAGDGELLAYLLCCVCLFGLKLWSILDGVDELVAFVKVKDVYSPC